MTSGRKAAGAIRSLVNARGLQLECARVLPEALLVPLPLHGSETMIWREKEGFIVRAIQMDNLRGLLDIRKMNRVSNARNRELWGRVKEVDERIEESVLRWFGNIKRIENKMIIKRVYVGRCVVSRLEVD